MKSSINVCQFIDYRTYLAAYSQEMKQRKPHWSYGAWARSLGLKSTSSITKIIQGKREPGPRITDRLVDYFAFNDKQARYFRNLVQLRKVHQDPRVSAMLIERMEKEHPDPSLRILDNQQFLAISNWYYLAVRELCRSRFFQNDPDWISKQFLFKTASRDVKRALQVLQQLGLLKKDKANRLCLAEGRVDTANDVASEGIKQYHEQVLEHAKTAVRTVPVDEREITSTTLMMSSENLTMAKELIREFKEKFERLLEEDDGDRLYQLQIQLFPMTKTLTKKLD